MNRMKKEKRTGFIEALKEIFKTMGNGFEAGNTVEWPSRTQLPDIKHKKPDFKAR